MLVAVAELTYLLPAVPEVLGAVVRAEDRSPVKVQMVQTDLVVAVAAVQLVL